MTGEKTRTPARPWLGFGTGILLVLSSGAHAFLGWPQFAPALESAGLDADFIAALAVGWYFGSMAMLVFGLIVLLAAGTAGKRKYVPADVCWIIAAGYLLFGSAAYLARDFNPHFLLFVTTGIFVGVFALSLKK